MEKADILLLVGFTGLFVTMLVIGFCNMLMMTSSVTCGYYGWDSYELVPIAIAFLGFAGMIAVGIYLKRKPS